MGSQAAKYGGRSELLYDQFDLFSCERMRHQIVLLRDCIRNIKLTFNKEFDKVLKLKEAEIKRIKVCEEGGRERGREGGKGRGRGGEREGRELHTSFMGSLHMHKNVHLSSNVHMHHHV